MHEVMQQKPPKRSYFHWHGPGAKCWCRYPLHAPQDQCNNCYSNVADYVNCRLHMTEQQDQQYLGVQTKPIPLLKIEEDNPAEMTAQQSE